MDQNPLQRQTMISGKDRISELPNAIISEILSLLPTRDAVATSILSKKWKDQWTYCFNLDFRGCSYLYKPNLSEEDEMDPENCIVKDVIALNKSPCIKKFQLQIDMMYADDVYMCLDSILRRNVEAIELVDTSFDDDFSIALPKSLFTCQTLVFLDLSVDAEYDLPPSIHLPSLKVFRANIVELSNEVATTLFCGLPVLEDLSVSIWYCDDNEISLNIFTPCLKRLKLKLFEDFEYQIIVRAPSLKELDIYNILRVKYVFEELPLDVKARLEFSSCAALPEEDEYAAPAIQLMNRISSVKSLALPGCILWTYFHNAPHHVAVFPNVICLEVNVTSCCRFTYLPHSLDRLPNLVSLVLKMETSHKTPSHQKWRRLQHEPQSSLLHLKRIEVRGFKGKKYELELLGYLSKVAPDLDEMVIYTPSIALEERKILCQKLSSFPCGSKNCQIKILENGFEDEE